MTVVFDYDGVLVNTLRANIDAINAFSEKYEFPKMDEEAYIRMLDANFAEYWQMLLGASSSSFMEDLHTYNRPHPVLLTGMKDLLLELKPPIVSSNHSSLINAVLNANGIHLPVYGVEQDPSKVRKLTKLQKRPDIFVTDTTGDVREGKLAGYTVIAVTWGFMPRASLERSQPHAIVTTPHELREAILHFSL